MERVVLNYGPKLLERTQCSHFMRIDRFNLVLVIVTLGFTVVALARDLYEVKIENNVTMKTRDGVTLRADVYRPKAEGKFPVLLERTPYDKRSGVGLGLKGAAQGYIYIV